jgi:cobyric acid synthase
MNQVMNDIWPILLGAIVSAIGLYIGFINNLRTEVRLLKEKIKQLEEKCKEVTDEVNKQVHLNTIMEEKVKKMETRQESHSKKYDELLELINDIKLEMVKNFTGLRSEINSFNAMIEASDKGVKINKKNKKG